MQIATFVSSADHKATRSADRNVPSGFGLLRAKLCAGSPGLIVKLLLASLVIGQCAGHAEENVKLTSVATTETNSTNTLTTVPKMSVTETNFLSYSFLPQPAMTNLLATTTNFSKDDFSSVAAIFALEKKIPGSTSLFSEQPGNGNFGFANFQAGYGQAYDCDSVLLRGRNGTAWEEPRYLFVKKVVRF